MRSKAKKCLILAVMCATIAGGPLAPYVSENMETVCAEQVGDFTIFNGVIMDYSGTDTEVVIPDGVTAIDQNAFRDETQIISVSFPDSITKIGFGAFRGCSSLKEITIPDSVTDIGQYAFYECGSLISLTLSNNVADIYKNTFKGCSSLKSLELPRGVKSIWDDAFSDCSSLTELTIPASVESINPGAFSGCSALEKITVAEDNKMFDSRENCNAIIWSEGNELRVGCKNTVIPDSVTCIAQRAFDHCTSLTDISIPDSVTQIGRGYNDGGAFQGCTSLTNIMLPDKITAIDDDTFYGCSSLTDITIPESVTSIGNNAFNECSSLKRIVIPNKVADIGRGAFYDCAALEDVVLSDSLKAIPDRMFQGCSSLKSILIPESVTSIDGQSFQSCPLTNVTIPASVTHIDGSAFSRCAALELMVVDSANTVYDSRNDCNAIIETESSTLIAGCQNTLIPNGIRSIGANAFDGRTFLTQIGIPEGVTSIEWSAFMDCNSLEKIVISSSVTDIKGQAFSDCSSLADVYYTGSEEAWNAINISDSFNDALKKAVKHYDHTSCQVKFDTYGVTAEIDPVSVNVFSTIEKPEDPKSDQYKFLYWTCEGEQWDFDQDLAFSDMTLVAKWASKETVYNGGLNMRDGQGNKIIRYQKGYSWTENAMSDGNYAGWSCSNSAVSLKPTPYETQRDIVTGITQQIGGKGCTITLNSMPSNPIVKIDVYVSGFPLVSVAHQEFSYRVVKPLESIELANLSLEKGTTKLLGCTTVPDSNYSRAISGFKFSSSDEGIATVDELGFVTGLRDGTVTITAYADDAANGSLSANCIVRVGTNTQPEPVTTEVPSSESSSTEIPATTEVPTSESSSTETSATTEAPFSESSSSEASMEVPSSESSSSDVSATTEAPSSESSSSEATTEAPSSESSSSEASTEAPSSESSSSGASTEAPSSESSSSGASTEVVPSSESSSSETSSSQTLVTTEVPSSESSVTTEAPSLEIPTTETSVTTPKPTTEQSSGAQATTESSTSGQSITEPKTESTQASDRQTTENRSKTEDKTQTSEKKQETTKETVSTRQTVDSETDEEDDSEDEDSDEEDEDDKGYEKGDEFTAASVDYVITKLGSSPEVSITGYGGKQKNLTLRDTVKDEYGVTYKVTSIASDAFASNSKLVGIKLGKNIKTISSQAFNRCTKLRNVKLNTGLNKIGTSAFSGCTAIKRIVLPAQIAAIEKNAFNGCKNLKYVQMKSLKAPKFGKNCFKGIYRKATFKVPAKKKDAYKKKLTSQTGRKSSMKIQ